MGLSTLLRSDRSRCPEIFRSKTGALTIDTPTRMVSQPQLTVFLYLLHKDNMVGEEGGETQGAWEVSLKRMVPKIQWRIAI